MSSPASAANRSPEISVIMAVYNGAEYLAESVQSILNQSFTDIEFIIVNDGSTDKTGELLNLFAAQDSRVVIINQSNIGLTRSLNIAAAQAHGKYIARQDADDVSYSHRLRKQLDMFTHNPVLVLAGGVSDDLYENGGKGSWPYHDERAIHDILTLKTPFPHSTAMMRTDIFRKLNGYDESFRTSQDMELWMRFAQHGKVAMLREPILLRRIQKNSISVKKRGQQFRDALRARLKQGKNPLTAFYYSVRGLLISMLPPAFIQILKPVGRP